MSDELLSPEVREAYERLDAPVKYADTNGLDKDYELPMEFRTHTNALATIRADHKALARRVEEAEDALRLACAALWQIEGGEDMSAAEWEAHFRLLAFRHRAARERSES